MALKKCDCALCDHAGMREDICGIYCVGGFWKQPDGSCDHYVDYLEKRRSDPAPAGPTNADRIRAMSDAELAVTLMCPNEMGMADIPCDHSDNKNCCLCLLDWLQQPAPEEGEQNV